MEQHKVMPITDWKVGHAPSIQRGIMKLAYLSQPKQSADAADESPIYAMTPEQMRAMAQALQKVADQLDQPGLTFGY